MGRAFLDELFRFRIGGQFIRFGTLLLEESEGSQFGQGEAFVISGLNLLGLSPEGAPSTDEADYDKGSFQNLSNRYFFEGQGISIETFRL